MGLNASSLSTPKRSLSQFHSHCRFDAGPVFKVDHVLPRNRQLTTFCFKLGRGWFVKSISKGSAPESVCLGLQSDSSSPPMQVLHLVEVLYSGVISGSVILRNRSVLSLAALDTEASGVVGAQFTSLLGFYVNSNFLAPQMRWLREQGDTTSPLFLLPLTHREVDAFWTGGISRVISTIIASGQPSESWWCHVPTRRCSVRPSNEVVNDSLVREAAQADIGYVSEAN